MKRRVYEHEGHVYIIRERPPFDWQRPESIWFARPPAERCQYAIRENGRVRWLQCREGSPFLHLLPYTTVAKWRSRQKAWETRRERARPDDQP